MRHFPVVFVLVAGVLAAASAPRRFDTVVNLETTSEDSANVSMGDLDGDGDLDLVLAKGRHTPLLDRVLLNDGKGGFVASDLGPTADRTYTAALADLDGDGDLDVLTSNDTPDRKLVYLNNGKGRFTVAGTWGVAEWSTRNAAVADLNGDGKADVIAANRPGPSFVCLNQGAGRFATDCIPIPAKSATSIVPADFDKDGFIDLGRAEPRRRAESHLLQRREGRFREDGALRSAGCRRACRRRRGLQRRWLARSRRRRRGGRIDGRVSERRQGAPHGRVPRRGQGEDAVRDRGGRSRTRRQPGHRARIHVRAALRVLQRRNRPAVHARSSSAMPRAPRTALPSATSTETEFPDIALARSGAPNVLYLSGK